MKKGNFSLSGKKVLNSNNLSGKLNKNSNELPIDIEMIKSQIVNFFLIPLISQKWDKVIENKFLIEIIKAKLIDLYNRHLNKDLLFYKDVIVLAEAVINEHNELISLEKKLYGDSNDVGTVVYRTKMIKLKAEFELYNLILGKPDSLNDYNSETLISIKNMLTQQNITFDKIRENIKDL